MKKNFTLKNFLLRKEGWLSILILIVVFVFGCYEFKWVNQPTEGYTNSTFDVGIVMTEDNDASNDWTYEDLSLTKHGLFGVLLPEGWTIMDSSVVTVVCADSMQDANGTWKNATSDHSGEYYLGYSASQTQMLNDSTQDPPPGYYWWGAKSTEALDMAFFDSLYFTLTVMTDDKTGEFYLQYVAGDVDYWGRMPFDPNVQTDPMPITIVSNVGIYKVLREAELSVYPNPARNLLNIAFYDLPGQAVDLLIYDVRGKQVLHRTLHQVVNTLDIADFKTGTYFLRMQSGSEVLTKKFIKY
jgi:hypothetical protein